MLERFGITDKWELTVFVCLILLVAITPAGKEATQPAALFLRRTP